MPVTDFVVLSKEGIQICSSEHRILCCATKAVDCYPFATWAKTSNRTKRTVKNRLLVICTDKCSILIRYNFIMRMQQFRAFTNTSACFECWLLTFSNTTSIPQPEADICCWLVDHPKDEENSDSSDSPRP